MRNYFGGLGFGGPGNFLDPRVRLSQQLVSEGTSTAPVQHWAQGLGRMGQALIGAYLGKAAMDDRSAATDALMAGLSPKVDTSVPVGAVANAQESVPMKSGGYADALQALQNMQGNPYAAQMGSQLAVQKLVNDTLMEQEQRKRGWQLEDRNANQDFTRELRQGDQAFSAGQSQLGRDHDAAMQQGRFDYQDRAYQRGRADDLADRKTAREAAMEQILLKYGLDKELKQWEMLNKETIVPAGSTLMQGGQPVYTAPEKLRDWQMPGYQEAQAGIHARKEQIKADAESAKPMPAAAVKMQGEYIDAMQTAKSMDADLAAFQGMLENGALDLGTFENVWSRTKNYTGFSDKESRNFGSFEAALEKMRNDSLRLNKGIQTEGDAQRAWNELLANINDPVFVKQRLAEIRAINRRAAELQQFQIDTLRQNFGKGPLEQMPQPQGAPGAGGAANDPLGIR